MAKRDPFDDDSEETEKPTDLQDSEEKTEKVSTEPDPNDEGSEPGDSEEKKQERREKRAERGRLREAAEAERNRSTELERQLNEERATRAATEVAARQWADYAQRQAQPQKDAWEQALENEVTPKRQALMAEHRQLVESGKYTPEEQRRLATEWNKLDIRQQELITHKQLYIRDQYARQQAPQQEEQARAYAALEQIKMRYPDIVANPQAATYMTLTHQRMTYAERKPNDWNTADLAASETRRAFKMGGPPAPDAATKARYSGVGGGANGHANGDGMIEMSPKFKRMAEALHPDDKPSVAWKKWAQGPGKRIKESES